MHSNQEFQELFQKYLSGSIVPDEIKRLRKLVVGMDEPSLDYQLQQLWNGYLPEHRNEKAFQEIAANLKAILHPEKRRSIGYYFRRSAAAVLLPVLFTATAYLLYERRSIESLKNQECIIYTDKGERASVTLPDGTKVYLNTQTSLVYPVSFAFDNRIVKLNGEAYFEVTHDRETPFIVQSSQLEIKVLGTKFNLYTYPDDCWFEATLVEGKVEASPVRQPESAVVLNPGQKLRYNSVTGEINVTETDLRVETAWRTAEMVFRSESLQTVLKKLESFYGVPISVEGAYPNELFSGSFHDDDINMVLTNLQNFYQFSFRKTPNEISIKFK